jgi:DNA-binding winged helix-turn-helix (wHTH) protein
MIYTFLGCELDEELFQLRRHGEVIKLEPKSFDLLLHLIHNRERVVSKQELLDAVWPDAAVSETVLPSCVGSARRAVGDDRTRSQVIHTVHGRGYRFVAPVEERAPERASVPSMDRDRRASRHQPSSPFLGRESAMERLREALASALSGRGRVTLLVGEPGIGKTRTAEEFASEAHQRGAAVLFARCHEAEGAPAFWPWVQILRALVREADSPALVADLGPGASDLAELLPELRERLGELPPSSAGDENQARFRLFESATGFLLRAATRRPLALVIDDLHWADEGTLRLIQFLTGSLREARLLLVGTYRDLEIRRGHPLEVLLAALAREPLCERIPLRGLGREDVARFVGEMLGTAAPEQLASAVAEMTEGNPFFIQELVRLLPDDADLAARSQNLSLALPQSVRAAIGRRLDGLSNSCNRLLRTASVLGREFSASILESLAELPRAELLEKLAEALEARVLVESQEAAGGYAFHHALVRQTLYDELNMAERLRLHHRAGEALEVACGALSDPHLAELAHHYFQASLGGDPDKAVDFCARAAERANRLLAYEETARYYQQALQALELCRPLDEARRCELLLELGTAHYASGSRDRSRSAFGSAAEIARRLARPDLLARAAVGFRGFAEMGSPPEDTTLALLEEARAALGEDHPSLRARILSRLVGTPPYSHSMEGREQLSREAWELARHKQDPTALRDALGARRWACHGPDRIDERFEVAAELMELAEQLGDPAMSALGHDVLMGAHLLRGAGEAADRSLVAYEHLAQELRQPVFIAQAIVWKASRALHRGEFREAEKLIHEGFERGRSLQPHARFVFEGQMYFLRVLRGDLDYREESRIFFGEMMEMPYSWEPAIRTALASSHTFRGETEQARREFESLAARDFSDFVRDEHWLPTMGSLGGVAAALGDERRGARLYQLLEPYEDLMMIHDLLRVSSGSVAMVLGNLATLLESYHPAALHFQRALALEETAGTRLGRLVTQASFARMLLLRDGPGDRERAEALLAEAKAGWESRGVRGNPRLLGELETLSASRLRR